MFPNEERYLYITAEMLKGGYAGGRIRESGQAGGKAMSKGVIGELAGAKVVVLPTGYLPAVALWLPGQKGQYPAAQKDQHLQNPHQPPASTDGWWKAGYTMTRLCWAPRRTEFGRWCWEAKSRRLPRFPLRKEPDHHFGRRERIIYTTNGADPRYDDKAKAYTGAVSTTEWGSREIHRESYGLWRH